MTILSHEDFVLDDGDGDGGSVGDDDGGGDGDGDDGDDDDGRGEESGRYTSIRRGVREIYFHQT